MTDSPEHLKPEHLRPAANAVFRPLDDGGVILDVETGAYFEVNRSGRLLWETIGAGSTRAALIAALEGEYALPGDMAAADVDEFVSELARRSLLEDAG